jgi:hypothetical protein
MLLAQRFLRGNSSFAIFAATMALLILVLSACGSNQGGQGGPGLTSTPTQQVQKCGAVHTLHLQIVQADQNTAKQAEDCFWQAFQQCKPATLTYSQGELDTGMIHTFSLQNTNGKCSITDGVQHYIAPRPPSAAKLITCSDVTLQSDGLHVSCNEIGTVFIPRP